MSTDNTQTDDMTDEQPTNTDDSTDHEPRRGPDGRPYPHTADEVEDPDSEPRVPLTAALDRRIRAERDPGETVADWVLAATATRLARADHYRDRSPVEAVATARAELESIDEDAVDDDTKSRLMSALEPLDEIVLNASAGDVVAAARSGPEQTAPASEQTDVGGDIAVGTPALRERIALETGPDETVEEWVDGVVRMRLAELDHEHWDDYRVDVPVDLPQELYERIMLQLTDREQRGDDVDFEDVAFNYVSLEPDWGIPAPDTDAEEEPDGD